MGKKIRNKYHRENLLKELKKGYLEATKEMTVNGIIKIIKTIENLEIELDNARKEILRLNNIDIEEDIKELISNEDIPNVIDYTSYLDDDEEYWYILKAHLEDEGNDKKRDCTIKRYKDTSDLYDCIENILNDMDIKEVENTKEKKVFSSDKFELNILTSKEKKKKRPFDFMNLSCK